MNVRKFFCRGRRIDHRLPRGIVPVAATLAWCLIWVGIPTANAQTDRVYTADGQSVTGTVGSITKDQLTLKKGSKAQTIAAGDVVKILWEGDPSELTNAREFALSRQYDAAIAELKKLDSSKLRREGQKADAAFYRAMSTAGAALAGRGSVRGAATEVRSFLGANSDSFHFYDATELFGDLALALGKADDAVRYYSLLGRSQSGDTKLKALYLVGTAKAAAGDLDAAVTDLDRVASVSVTSSQGLRTQTLARAAKASVLARQGQADESLQLISELIADLTPTDVLTAAAIYNAQGEAYEAKQDAESAIAAYLHTHLMYASDPQRHAVALSKLIPLWEQVGRPERAGEMRSLLKELYPGFGRNG